MNQKKTGTFIAACRKEHEMTQMQFAEKLGVTNKAVSKWETGKCMPDASLFDDICLLLDISLNELFAGERIPSENIIEKTEQNLMNMVHEYQKKDHHISFCKYCTALLVLISASVNLCVGGIWFDGMPVISNLILTILLITSWSIFLYLTQENVFTQKIAIIFHLIFLLSSITAFILTFWDVDRKIVYWTGFPCNLLFYGLKLIFDWIHVYLAIAIMASIGLAYSKKNISAKAHD